MRRPALALPLAAAACTTAPVPPPRVAPPPQIVVPSLPPAVPDWRDTAYTPGAWTYADGVAAYGMRGAPPLLTMTCDRTRRVVVVTRAGAAAAMTIRTSYAERTWPAQATADGRSLTTFAASDPVLDQIAFSRGRFSIAGPGLAEIAVPAWAEPARVVEDCRS